MKILWAVALALATMVAHAEPYPGRPIKLIVPFAPGGSADLVGRLLAQQLSESLGQPVVVENKGGASGMLGNEYVAKSAPDGYTLTVGTLGPFAVNQTLYEHVPYDNIRDFAPITLTGISSHILVAHPSVPVHNVNQLIALAKEKPGQLTFASSGTGNATHISFELFKARAGIDIVHVPYKGGGPAMADLVGGQVLFSFASMASAVPFVRSGRLRAIAVSGGARSALFPDVPTVAESGLPGFASEDWQGILAPAKTPADIVEKLNGQIGRILLLPEVKAKLQAAGFDPKPSTPEWFAQFIQAETLKWAKLLKGIGVKAQ
jgi:tripartite-type tricarboxylate transporter receptor subunit TctC